MQRYRCTQQPGYTLLRLPEVPEIWIPPYYGHTVVIPTASTLEGFDCSLCNIRGCKTFQHTRATDTFQSEPASCTRRAQLSATCKNCGKQYVGETENALHIHYNGHKTLRPGRWKSQWLPTSTPSRTLHRRPHYHGYRENKERGCTCTAEKLLDPPPQIYGTRRR